MKSITKLLIIILSHLLFFFNIESSINKSSRIKSSLEKIDNNKFKIYLQFHVNNDESIHINSINIVTDNPNITLLEWQSKNNYLTSSSEINKDFKITIEAIKNTKNEIPFLNLYISYLINNKIELHEEKIILDSNKQKENKENKNLSSNLIENKGIADNSQKKKKDNIWTAIQNISLCTQNVIKTTNSIWLKLFLVFILGILMSFTPCIYPVIPITAGILQMQGSKSILYNFFLSVAYALGIALTFAFFGLTAALSGHLFGQILIQPIFVIFISLFLIYLAFSMFGFYDMYVPKFLNSSNKIKHKGSLLSAFIFGAISGSIASPCLSPGLALLLTIVASLANKLLGFLLLFSFGIGLSLPLIFVGTFSGSINLLPRAGMWMVEVKKIFGFLLIGLTFYYLNNILPTNIILFMVGITLFISGIWYFKNIEKFDSKFLKLYKNILGLLLIIISIFVLTKAFQNIFYKFEVKNEEEIWSKNYDETLKTAQTQNKKLIIDVGASFCTLCKAIDKLIFNDAEIKKVLKKFALVKIDATNTELEPYNTLKNKYKIIGVPTILIINPNSGELLKRYEGEIYNMPKEQILKELENII